MNSDKTELIITELFIIFLQLWSQRPRLNSQRTVSECSEGRGTMVDVDVSSHTSSLKRTRNRGDSAYMSPSLSVASEIPATGLAVEEDPNGYVMPRTSHHPETGDIPFASLQLPIV